MPVQKDKQFDALKNRLTEKFEAKQIIIFGSNAYGKPDKESDIDLCVVADLKEKRKIEFIREIRHELLDLISNSLDILVLQRKFSLAPLTSFSYIILREVDFIGRICIARPNYHSGSGDYRCRH